MLKFLTELFSGAKRRRIFRYQNGWSWRWADPIVLQRELDKAGGDNWTAHLDILRLAAQVREAWSVERGEQNDPATRHAHNLSPALAAEQGKAVEEAIEALARIVRKAFRVQEVNRDGYGLTEAECINLLAQFLGWMAEAEADARPFQSSPRATGPCPANSTTG